MFLYDSEQYRKDLQEAVFQVKDIEKLKGSSVLIAGAAGLIGSFVADMLLTANELLDTGIKVLAMGRSRERLSARFQGWSRENLVLVEQDVAEPLDLDFQVDYTNKDEMGQLCQEFERMRRQLVLNNQKLWRTIEEEKALRSAVSHDLRSPLSVLKGYLEMLEEFRKAGILDQEKEGKMLEASRKQVQRMDQFVDMMAKLNSLGQRVLKSGPVIAKELEQEIRQAFTALGRDKQLDFHISENTGDFLGDREVILEVAENLLSNACRYAEKVIEIDLSVTSRELKIRVKDDGEGFQEDKEELTKAFYQQNIKDSLKHTGLGMYISRLYCEKHGGSLLLENDQAGGAVVTAIFRKLSH